VEHTNDHLASLNTRQREAVSATKGPVLILAGAGAGKTKTITHRILHLIHSGVAPQEILAITFTNKAAKEMRERVFSLIEHSSVLNRPLSFTERPFVSTFHSLGVHILREHSQMLGLPRQFSIFDRNDSLRAIKEALNTAGFDPKTWEPPKILGIISREKGKFVTRESYGEKPKHDYVGNVVSQVWRHYEHILKDEKALDFDDLLIETARLLQRNPDIRQHYQNTWKYVHVDEYQDTNHVQYALTQLFIGPEKNICVVGDIDQMIYSWRGATIDNILHFERDYPDAQVVILEENYRSTKTILSAANTIIIKNSRRREKNLFTSNDTGEKISLFGAYDEAEEGCFVAETARELIARGVPAEEIAVLYRANFQSRVLEEACIGADIPYQVLGTRFFERKEIKDVLAYIRVALNRDSWGDIKRIINVPVRGIGKATLAKVVAGMGDSLPASMQLKIASFWRLLDAIKGVAETEKPSDAIKFVAEKSGMQAAYEKGSTDDLERIENIKELVTLATRYNDMPRPDGLTKLLEDAALASDQDELDKPKEKEGIRLMTVHASKGLEFKYIFIVGLEDGLFPHERRGEGVDEEEERRLFYVAITRARHKVFLSYASTRMVYGKKQINVPSEFITDIDDALLEPAESKGRGGVKTVWFD